MVIKAVFFDFDGTIFDSWDLAARAFERVLGEFGIDYGNEDLKLLGMKMGKILGRLGVSADLVEQVGDKFFEYFEDEVVAVDLKSCCNLGVLRELSRNFSLVVVSNARKDYLDLVVEKLGIRNLFERVVGADDSGRDKDEIVVDLVEEMGLERDEVLYVGDRFSDVRFARKAEIRCVAVSNGCSWSSREELEKESPDFLINNLDELKDVIVNIKD